MNYRFSYFPNFPAISCGKVEAKRTITSPDIASLIAELHQGAHLCAEPILSLLKISFDKSTRLLFERKSQEVIAHFDLA
jgi:hypothetical protein